jgi:sec-independent protein translocase protein TatB
MFDLDWSKMAILAAVALVVIGPKDLPRVLRTLGQWTGRARAMAREFQNSIEELARESELDALKKDVEKLATTDVAATIDPSGELQQSIEEVHKIARSDSAMEAPAAPTVGTPNAAEATPTPHTHAAELATEPLPKTGTGAPV